MKKHVLAAPDVDKPESPVRESLDGAFCHLPHLLRDRPGDLPENTVLGIFHREAQIISGRGMTSTEISQIAFKSAPTLPRSRHHWNVVPQLAGHGRCYARNAHGALALVESRPSPITLRDS